MPVGPPSGEMPLLAAAVDLVGRMGGEEFQVRYDEEQDPVVWVAVARFRGRHEAAGGMRPDVAAMRLIAALADGGFCTHCRRPTGVTPDWEETMPLADVVCWYVFDPELTKFRRSCEGDDHGPKLGRNDPCPCGSGRKAKHCHGRGL